jgi:hypothetical protein
MSSSVQIFKEKVPIDFLFVFLDKICDKTNDSKCYILNITSHKKMYMYHYHTEFIGSILQYYQNSKRFYVERTLTYKSLANIIRQICKSHLISITARTIYFDSKYWTEYLIPISEYVKENEMEINEPII